MKTICKAFVIQPLGTGFQEAGPAVSHYSGVCYLMGTEREKPCVPTIHSPIQLSGNDAGKSLTVLTAQTDRAIKAEQVMGGVELVSAKSMQGMQHSDLGGGGGGQGAASGARKKVPLVWYVTADQMLEGQHLT